MKVKKAEAKIVVLGIDGATYSVLDRLLAWGILPNLALIFKKGGQGNLLSTLPPMTGTAWASFATGKNPAKHGCFNFFLPTKNLNETKICSSQDVVSKTFYEILEEHDKKCVLINMPVSWPPRLKKGITIGSWLATKEDFVFPAKLIKEIPELSSYQLFPDFFTERGGSIKEYIKELRKIEKQRFIVAKKLFRKDWDFFFCLFSSIDWLQHKALKELLSPSLNKDSFLLSLFKDIDDYLGWFIKNLPKDAFLILLSDHGFKVYPGRFYLNRWLENKGLLKVVEDVGERNRPRDFSRKKLKVVYRRDLSSAILRELALRTYQAPFLYWLFGSLVRVAKRFFPGGFEQALGDISDIGLGIDPQKTKVYSILGSFGQAYINQKGRFQKGMINPSEAEKIKKRLIRELGQLRDPVTGKKAAQAVYKKEEVYSGPLLSKAPDIILEAGDFWIKPTLSAKRLFSHQEIISHDREGIFGCLGPGVKKGKISQVELYDFAPTILNLFKIKTPRDMDGKTINWGKENR
jgi:predicted AlkP superfamily phosphohydrolase/phosphomutase